MSCPTDDDFLCTKYGLFLVWKTNITENAWEYFFFFFFLDLLVPEPFALQLNFRCLFTREHLQKATKMFSHYSFLVITF